MKPSIRRLAPVLLLLTGAAGYKVEPPPLVILPGLAIPDDQAVFPGDVVARSPLGRPEAAVLLDPVLLDRLGTKHQLLKQTILDAASVRGGVPGDPPSIFCEPEPVPRTSPRFCVFDSNGDEAFDKAILVGAAGAAGHTPFPIGAVRYGLISGIPAGENSEVRLRYAGPAGEKGSVAFDLEVTLLGKARTLVSPRYVVPLARLPAHEIILDAVVTVSKFDPATRMAVIRMNRDLAPGYLPLPLLADPPAQGNAAP